MTRSQHSVPELLARIAELESIVAGQASGSAAGAGAPGSAGGSSGGENGGGPVASPAGGETEARLNMLTQNLPAIIWSTDCDLIFTSSAGSGLAVLGLQPDEIVGRSLFEYFQTEDRDVEPIAAHYRALRGATVDYEQVWADSHFRTHVEPLRDRAGTIVGTIGVAVDITENIKAEEALQQTEKLETLGVLAGGVAHDFNNLLLAILGNTEMLTDRLRDRPEEVDLLNEIAAAATRGAKLTDSMLSYSGRARFQAGPVDLNNMIGEMRQLLDAVLPKKVLVGYEFDPDLAEVLGDDTQLKQVVLNLVTNAAEACGDGAGAVRVRTHMLFADEGFLEKTVLGASTPAGQYVAIEVEDNGWGMDKDARSKVFDPFFTTKFTGRGLGLPAVLGIVKRHRGAINLESRPGEGTRITVLLPMAEKQSERTPLGTAAAHATGRRLVLIADDEEQVRTLLSRTLERSGFATLMARDGREAVDAFRARSNDIAAVLLDMTMPVLGGEEVFKEIRAIDGSVPVLLMSGYTESDALGRFTEGGPAGFLHKPFSPGFLTEKIRSVLR